MRPTVTEQLSGIRKILERLVAPEVTDEYVAAQLQTVLGALDGLAARWRTVLPALIIDIGELETLLHEALPQLRGDATGGPGSEESELAEGIERSLGAPAVPPSSFDEVHERHVELRALLVRLIRFLDSSAGDEASNALRGQIRAHLRASMDRLP
jgi:hypothetical protein